MRLWCIHGNLQTPDVWQQVGYRWWETVWTGEVILESVNVWEAGATTFHQWSQDFCQRVQSYALMGEQQWLMGYSLGGRLALHAVLDAPQLWAGSIAIAADPGIKTGAGARALRERCLQRDREWGQRFLQEPWAALLQDWDRQTVFAGYSCSTERSETAFERRRIGQLFDRFSKGRQADLRPALVNLERPSILYISGQDDSKYCAIGAELSECCPAIRHAIVPHAGHRVPWENSTGFVRAIAQFVRSKNG